MNEESNYGPWWKVGREIGIFVIGAVSGVLLSLQSGLWLGIPIVLVIAIGLYLRRPEAAVRMEWVVAAFQLIRTFLGGYSLALLAASVQGIPTYEGTLEHFTFGRVALMLFCLGMMAVVHKVELWAQQFEED